MKRKHRSFKRRIAWVPPVLCGAALPLSAAPQSRPQQAAGVRSKSTVLPSAAMARLAWRVRLVPTSAGASTSKPQSAQKPRLAPGLSLMSEETATGIAHVAPSFEMRRYTLGIAPSGALRLTAPAPLSPASASNAAKPALVPIIARTMEKTPVAPAVVSAAVVSLVTPKVRSLAKPAAALPAQAAATRAPRMATAPVVKESVVKEKAVSGRQGRGPTDLSARHKDRMLLAQFEADLNKSESSLNRANSDLTQSQRQLAAFGDTLRAAMMEAGPDATGLHPFVKVAQRYAGTPYVWGGESGRGFDCSGFIIRVMRDLGYKALPHSAAEQFRYGLPIANALLKPGDLVFFANTYKPGISHVGIYLGRRRFIHAAGTGLGTIVSSLDAAKFRAKYAGARRLMSQ